MEAARELWDQVLEIRRESPSSARVMGRTLYEYGLFLTESGSPAEAEPVLAEALELLRPIAASSPAACGRAELALGACLLSAGRIEEASEYLHQAEERLRAAPDAREADRTTARNYLSELERRGD